MPINTYTVEASHPELSEAFTVQLIATSERAAISRTRGSLVHMRRELRWLDADYEITDMSPGIWPGDRTEHTRGRA